MTDFEMPEKALIRKLRERLGDEQASAVLEDFGTYLTDLGDNTYRQAWNIVSREAPTDAEHVLSRAERRAKVYKGMALALMTYRTDAFPEPPATVPAPAWAADTVLLMEPVPAPA